MIIKTVLYFFLASYCLVGCTASKKTLFSKNQLYRVNESGDKPILEIYTLKDRIVTEQLVDKDSYLSINKSIYDNKRTKFDTIQRPIYNVNAYAPYRLTPGDPFLLFIQPLDIESSRKKFVYGDRRPIIQTLTIPLKFRNKPNLKNLSTDNAKRQASIDSFPQQTETGFSIGFALGQKFTRNVARNQKDAFNRYTNQQSLGIAGLVGAGAVDITRSTARFLPLTGFTSRRSPIISYGGMIMLGFNNINIGYAIGADHALGEYGSNWVFQDQLWQGVIIALDILK